MKEGRKPEYPEKTAGEELQKMPHTKALRSKPQARFEPVQHPWWQATKADTLTTRPSTEVRSRWLSGTASHSRAADWVRILSPRGVISRASHTKSLNTHAPVATQPDVGVIRASA